MTTSPDSIPLAADIAYGLLGPYPANSIDVQAFGLDPTGNDDCYEQTLVLIASLPSSGGEIVFPPGRYLYSRGFGIPSNVTVRGAGRGVTTLVAQPDFPGADDSSSPAYSFIFNEDWAATDLASGNSDIRIEGITFDYSWRTTNNAFASLKMRYVTRLTIRDCRFNYGGNTVAIRGCEQVWLENCDAYEFRNCAWDFWEGPGTTWILNNYAETSDAAQGINFNPEFSPTSSSPLDVVARRLTVSGNTIKNTQADDTLPCQIEPLANRDNSVFDVVITNNHFIATYLVCRQETRRLLITNNTFTGFANPSLSAIIVAPLNGRTPNGVVIANNVIEDPHTYSDGFGVIWCDAQKAVVTGNVITGTDYDAAPFYQGTSTPNQFGNYFEKLGITGRMRQGFIFTNPNVTDDNPRSAIGWEDLSGAALRMYMAGNFHQFWSTGESGTGRQVWSMEADDDNSDFSILIGATFNDHIRVSPNAGLTATGTTYAGALQLAKGFNTVTSVPAASGVRLPIAGTISITGYEVAVWNAGTETLSVYPASNAYINDDAIGVHDRVLPGWVKVWYATDATHWLVKAEFYYGTDLAGNEVSALESASSDVDLTLAPETQPVTYDYNHVLLYGQSLTLGAEGTPGLSTTAKYGSVFLGTTLGAQNNTTPTDVWLINGSGFNPLQINSTQAEAPIYSALATYRAMTYRSQDITSNSDQLMLASGCGIGGTAISQLQQGAVPDIFNRLVSCMSQAHTTATGLAATYGVTAMVWMQGESNSTTSQATYATALRDIYADFVVAALAETGQTADPALFMYQTTAKDTNFNTTNLGVQMAQLDIGLNDAGCFMVGPVYPYNSSNNLHLPANSYRWWGAQLGKVMHRVLTLGQNWKPLHITAATMRGQRVLLEYYVPVGPLVFQDSWLEPGWTPGGGTDGAANAPFDADDKGFTVINNAGTVQPIASVVLVAANQVLITLESAPSGAPYFVRYADGSAGHYGHGSLRDSDPALADDIYLDLQASQAACERQWDASGKRYPLYNWAVSQYQAITVV